MKVTRKLRQVLNLAAPVRGSRGGVEMGLPPPQPQGAGAPLQREAATRYPALPRLASENSRLQGCEGTNSRSLFQAKGKLTHRGGHRGAGVTAFGRDQHNSQRPSTLAWVWEGCANKTWFLCSPLAKGVVRASGDPTSRPHIGKSSHMSQNS